MDRTTLPLVRVAIADVVPLQRGLERAIVDAKRALIRDGEPIDAPLLFQAGDVYYVGDGHHTVQAAHEEGFTHIKGRVMDVGEITLEKARKRGLARASEHAVADPFRRQCVTATGVVRRRVTKALTKLGDAVADAVQSAWDDPAAEELSKAIPPDKDAATAKKINDLLAAFELEIAATLEEELSKIASGAGRIVLATIQPEGESALVDQVFGRAVDYSSRRTGELIGKNARGTGELAETTRNRIRAAITAGLEDNVGSAQIGDMLRDDFGFSEARADLIASTEIANANGAGSYAGLQEAAATGLQIEHAWLCEIDACEICLANQAQGWIPLEEAFDSGDQHPTAHPNCRCAEEARVVEPAVKMARPESTPAATSTPGDGIAKELEHV